MQTRHPDLPQHRPLTIVHRAGNSVREAQRAATIGCDLIETDIWSRAGRLEVRHMHRLGPLPILWEKWRVRLGWRRLTLHTLLDALDNEAQLFLDLKGDNPDLGLTIVELLRTHAPAGKAVLCGRNYSQLDPVVGEPGVTAFYSVGELKEFAAAWSRLERMEWPEISIHRKLATPETINRLKQMQATIVCWDVNTTEHARRLHELGVDGFTSDNLCMLRRIAERGAAALQS
jgi:glycerophosphoryl diester phosphodiesterase